MNSNMQIIAGESYTGVSTMKPESPTETSLWLQIKVGLTQPDNTNVFYA